MLGKQHAHVALLCQLARELHQRHALTGGHAGGGLVHQQQLGVGGQRHGQLHALDVAIGQLTARPVGLRGHAHLIEQRQRIAAPVRGSAWPPLKNAAVVRKQGHLHVFHHGE